MADQTSDLTDKNSDSASYRGLPPVSPKLDSLVNEVIRSFSLNTLILLNDVITMKLVYRLTIEHTYIYYFRPRSPRAWGGPSLVLSSFIGGISGALRV